MRPPEHEVVEQAQDMRDVIGRIAHCTDLGSLEDYAALLAEDVVIETAGAANSGIAGYVRHGRQEYVEAIAAQRAAGVLGPGSDSRHVVITAFVSSDGAAGEAWSHWLFYSQTSTSPQLWMMGRYEDSFKFADSRWQLTRRNIAFG